MEGRRESVKGDGGLLARIDALSSGATDVAAAIDPALLTGAEAERVLASLTRLRNVVSGAMAAVAARVAETERWRQAGATQLARTSAA